MYFQQRDLLHGMEKGFVKQLLDISKKETYDEGMFIFHEGDRADRFYILLKGCIKLSIGDSGHVVHIVDQAGEAFGWSSLVGHEAYSASAECISPTKVIQVEKEKCFKVLENEPESGMLLFQRLAALLGARMIGNYKQMSHISHAEAASFGTGQVIEMSPM